ncbi:diguanylate cyclase/phosphodiesterase (GGDEF & EAL domains) with PAS/PAC sensor(s) [Dissulfuribacter thermophilus]|uniref:Diguanylate cyclase/phosphodiesterase (GGDEF & EAL domains) with PAS/PAC sensor(S) n=1 Tax=Dissulfuribacter thermophilus TaxID=1156395 RepID=A0A1B9F4N7_9BACT|nr:EAL domain-containing protein [Dissulfuribacter thermophilus]OCC14900.1 diguanylate cyclase/phosphodiesterase (GGDEF & EAL domains) with PAS/PAC sensor(s) [Dissulfuribacter thermophilus]
MADIKDLDTILRELSKFRQSEERLRTLFEATPDVVCFKDGEGRWLEANSAYLSLFRLENIDFRGKRDSELAQYSPHFKDAFLTSEKIDEIAWKRGKLTRSQEYISCPDGETLVFDVYKIPIFNPDGSRKGLVVFGRDVTELIRAQDSLKSQGRHLEVINAILSLAWENMPLKERMKRILKTIFTIPWLSFESKGAIFLYDHKSRSLKLFVHKDLEEKLQHICEEIELGKCICGQAALKREIIFCDHITKEHDIRHSTMPDHGHYVVPIEFKGELLGVLCLYFQAGHKKNDEELKFLETLSKVLGQILSYEINRKHMEDALKRSKTHLVNAQRLARLGSFELNPDTGRIICSEGLLRLIGKETTDPEIKLDEFLEIICEKDRKTFLEAIHRVWEKREPLSLDLKIKPIGHVQVKQIHCELVFSPSIEGGSQYITGTIQDVTALRHNEKQLELATKIFENSIEGITITDKHGTILMVNPAFSRITGYSPEEVIGKNPRILKSDRHSPEFYKKMWDDILEKGQWSGEIWNRRKNGQAYPEHLTITAIKDSNGEITNYIALFHDISEIKEMRESLDFQINYDALTGLANRQLFTDRLNLAVRHAQSHNEKLAILLFDIDDFRLINEGIGYNVGDKILQEMARRLTKCIGRSDTVARLGGDEFAVFLDSLSNNEDVLNLSKKILEAMANPFRIGDHNIRLTISMGVTFFPYDGREAEELIKNAEIAMYKSKEHGKNALHIFTPQMNEKIKRRIQLEEKLHKALENEEFRIFFQPKINIKSGRIEGAEALIRWQNDQGDLVSPGEFISIAEETGLIISIGEWVLEKVCSQVRLWRQQGIDIHVAINLSPRQFRDKELVKKIHRVVSSNGIPADCIALEITEGVVMDDEENAISLLRRFKEIGIRLSMDDFGTGYSSLYYLKQFPIDELKIDRSFVMGIPDKQDSKAITTAIISLAKSLRLETVAEGVETEEQLEFLKRLNCDMVQGYLFSPPIPAEEFTNLVKK